MSVALVIIVKVAAVDPVVIAMSVALVIIVKAAAVDPQPTGQEAGRVSLVV